MQKSNEAGKKAGRAECVGVKGVELKLDDIQDCRASTGGTGHSPVTEVPK
jgi:hypothetical protein